MADVKKPEVKELIAGGHNMCAGCGEAIALRMISRSCPKDVIVAIATGCSEVTTMQYPLTAWNVPAVHCAFENVSAVASGIEAAAKKMGKDWKVLAVAGDGGTYDIGFQALSGMLERRHKVTQVCLNNEAYMNCLALSAEVLTEDGLKKITEVKKGDMVYAFDMNTRRLVLKECSGVFDNGRKQVFELTTLHHNIKATGNHPFLTVQRNGRGKETNLAWKTLEKLKVGDSVITLKNADGGRPFHFRRVETAKKGDYKVNKLNEVKLPAESSTDLMEFFGIFVGDGWTRLERGEIGFALPEGKPGRDRLLMLQERVFGLKPRLDKNYVYYNSVNLAKFIDSLGFNLPAKEKTVPDWVFTLPAEQKEAFIRGLMLSDGYRNGNSSRIVSASFGLLKRTRLLLQTMSYRVGKVHKQKKLKGTHCVYRKLLKDCEYGYICFSERSDWNIERYPSQYRYQNFLIGNESFETERVVSIKPVGVEPTLDLRVEGEHNFIADGIVVHNTGVQRSGATPWGSWTTTAPPGKKDLVGKDSPRKPLPFIVAAHGTPYVATASIAYPNDLMMKVKKAFENQPSFIDIITPCPTGWKFESADTVEMAKLAVDTGLYPLIEIENGKVRITRRGDLKPVEQYLSRQGRFRHLKPADVKKIQEWVDANWKELEFLDKIEAVFA